MSPRAVVTGSAGFIGARLVRELDAAGVAVTGIDRRPPPAGAPGAHLHCDLLAPIAQPVLGDVLRTADVVFHLAGRPGVRGSDLALEQARWRDNVAAATPVLDMTPARTPLVVASSSSVYGGARVGVRGGRRRPCHECDPLAPLGSYARSKIALEVQCARRRARGGRVSIVRPFTVAGEGQRPDMAIARWLRAGTNDEPLTVYGSLTRTRDITDVDDVVRGLLAVATLGADTTVNLGTGRGFTLAEMVDAVQHAIDRPVLLQVTGAGDEEPPATLADASRCERLLGFRPVTDLDALVSRQHHAIPRSSTPEIAGALRAP